MTVDLSGVLRSEFNKTKKEYERAIEKGNIKQSRIKALKCAQLLKQLADSTPAQKARYLESAKRWTETAQSADSALVPQVFKKTVVQDSGEEYEPYVRQLISTSKANWDDIGGLDEAKRLLMQTVVIASLKRPESIKPWRGILLFGPPGTGKTLLAAAAAGGLNATFFDVSADKVLSKYYGETSKLIGALYDTASKEARSTPSIVFVDEFDALSPSREGDVSEASRRALSTLLARLDGLKDKKTDKLVLTLAATNTPWDLDEACLSRFPKRIYVPLPDKEAAKQIITIQIKDINTSQVNLSGIAEECHNRTFSGRDISYLCQQAIWYMINDMNKDLHKLSVLPFDKLKQKTLVTRPLKNSDFLSALENTKSTFKSENLEKYETWAHEFAG